MNNETLTLVTLAVMAFAVGFYIYERVIHKGVTPGVKALVETAKAEISVPAAARYEASDTQHAAAASLAAASNAVDIAHKVFTTGNTPPHILEASKVLAEAAGRALEQVHPSGGVDIPTHGPGEAAKGHEEEGKKG